MRQGYLKVKEIKTSDKNNPEMAFVRNLAGAYVSLDKQTFWIKDNSETKKIKISEFRPGHFTDTYFFEVNNFKLRVVLFADMIQNLNPNSDFTIASIEHDKFAIIFELTNSPSIQTISEITETQANPLKIYKDEFNNFRPLPDISKQFEEYMRAVNYYIFDKKYHINSKMYLPAMAYVPIDFLIQCRTNYNQNMIPDKLVKQVQEFALTAFNNIYNDPVAGKEYEDLLSKLITDPNLYGSFKAFVERYNMQQLYPYYNSYK